jgi:MFS family permease
MVTTIDPVVHGGRNKRYARAVGLHVVGATAAAAAFGGVLGGLGALLGAPWRTWSLVGVAGAGVAYALRESVQLPLPLFDRRRQVPEWWRTFFSPPVAALLYGLGLGIGFMTFLTFGTFVAVAVVAVASGSPAVGALVCAPFGLARGLSVLVATGGGGGAAALDRLDRLAATRGPRLVNAVTLIALAGAAGVAVVS